MGLGRRPIESIGIPGLNTPMEGVTRSMDDVMSDVIKAIKKIGLEE
jgi:hypothetical protein